VLNYRQASLAALATFFLHGPDSSELGPFFLATVSPAVRPGLMEN
jgi:hypothetical protein